MADAWPITLVATRVGVSWVFVSHEFAIQHNFHTRKGESRLLSERGNDPSRSNSYHKAGNQLDKVDRRRNDAGRVDRGYQERKLLNSRKVHIYQSTTHAPGQIYSPWT